MNAAKSSLPDLKDANVTTGALSSPSRQRLIAECLYVGSTALLEAVWLQALLVGPTWPSGPLIAGLVIAQLVVWWVVRQQTTHEARTKVGLLTVLAVAAVSGVLRIRSGLWAVALAILAAIIMAYRGITATTDRPDPASAFRRISIAFIFTVVALYLFRLPKTLAMAVVLGLLLAGATALSAGRWLEMFDRRSGLSGLTVAGASGQMVALAILLVASAATVLTPKVLATVVLRPLGWLADLFVRLVMWAMLPVARLMEALILRLQARLTPQAAEVVDRMLTGNQPTEQPGPANSAGAALLAKYLSYVLFGVLVVVAYRILRAALARRRANLGLAGGSVTVTPLTSGASRKRSVRPVVRRVAAEPLDGSPAAKVRVMYRDTLRAAERAGIARRDDETPAAYAARLVSVGAAPEDVASLTAMYEDVRYGADRPSSSAVGAIHHAVQRIASAITARSPGAK